MKKNIKDLEFKSRVLYEANPKDLQNKLNKLLSENWVLVSDNVSFDKDNYCSVILIKIKND